MINDFNLLNQFNLKLMEVNYIFRKPYATKTNF